MSNEWFLREYLAGQPTGGDAVENVDVMWVPRNSMARFFDADTISPILAALEEQT